MIHINNPNKLKLPSNKLYLAIKAFISVFKEKEEQISLTQRQEKEIELIVEKIKNFEVKKSLKKTEIESIFKDFENIFNTKIKGNSLEEKSFYINDILLKRNLFIDFEIIDKEDGRYSLKNITFILIKKDIGINIYNKISF